MHRQSAAEKFQPSKDLALPLPWLPGSHYFWPSGIRTGRPRPPLRTPSHQLSSRPFTAGAAPTTADAYARHIPQNIFRAQDELVNPVLIPRSRIRIKSVQPSLQEGWALICSWCPGGNSLVPFRVGDDKRSFGMDDPSGPSWWHSRLHGTGKYIFFNLHSLNEAENILFVRDL
ncbi:unnamed protein product, partial [Nesidiocoris tenuis]